MAQVEPMDIDAIDSDFDNKENTYHHSNVLSRTPCTEKGYEELDVSELNMKLRYSITPASSPMSKSFTGSLDNRNCNHGEDYLHAAATDNGNLTRSLNSTFNKTESVKPKALPLQTLSSDPFVDTNRKLSTHRPIEPNDNNITITVSTNDDDLSLPSTSSSVAQTPEATTPTKEIPKPEGSPILRGIKSVLSMFRPSQSPIPPADDKAPNQDNILSPIETKQAGHNKSNVESVRASTPVDVDKKETNSSKRSSPLKESVVFNDDLERELEWKDETTIIFKHEKIPIHKLLFKNHLKPEESKKVVTEPLNTTVEYMDVSCEESLLVDKTSDDTEPCKLLNKNEGAAAVESDNEFLDCETTFTKNEADVPDIDHFEEENRNISSNVTVNLNENAEIQEIKGDINNTHIINNASASVSGSYYTVKETESNEIIKTSEQLLHSENCSNINEGANLLSMSNINIHLLHEEQESTHVSPQHNVTKDATKIIPLSDESVTKNIDTCEYESEIVNSTSTEAVINILKDTSSVCTAQLSKTECLGVIVSSIAYNDNNKTVENIESVPLSNYCKNDPDTNFMPLMTNIQKQSMSNTENPQVLHLELNNDCPVEHSTVTENKVVNEERISIIGVDREVTNDIIEGNVMKSVKNNEYVQENTIIESNISIIKTSDSNLLKINTTIDMEAQSLESCINDEKEISNQINKCDDNLVSEDNIHKTLNAPHNTIPSDFVSLEKVCEMSELSLGNNVIGKLPPDIPLPSDDDDIENSIKEENKVTEEVTVSQNVTFEIDSDKLKIPDRNNTEPNEDMRQVYNVEESSKISPLQNNNEHNILTNESCVEKHELDNYNIELKHLINNDCGNKIDTIKHIQTYNETQNLHQEIQKEVLTTTQETILTNAEDFVKQDTQAVCEITAIHMEKEEYVTNIETNTDVVPTINQEMVIEHLVESLNLDNHMFGLKDRSTEKCEDLVNSNKDKEEREADEEIITSANNSPYVSVTELPIDINQPSQNPVQESDYHFTTQDKICKSPPISPKIVSKGYNFNFDEIDDPFATKTKIRLSPTPESPNESKKREEEFKKAEDVSKKTISNRRKSQPDRKRVPQKKTLNTTVIGHSGSNGNAKKNNQKQNVSPVKDHILTSTNLQEFTDIEIIEAKDRQLTLESENENTNSVVESATPSEDLNDIKAEREEVFPTSGEIKCIEQTLVISDQKSTSSSEQYFSLGTSSGESVGLMNQTKNVFNIPEIDDVNFNPFATKSKMRMSPPPSESKSIGIENIINAKAVSSVSLQQNADKEVDIGDETVNRTITKESSPNVSTTTSSSKGTNDKDLTVREVLTEDEDTIEGPFLEVDDLKDLDKSNVMEVAEDMMNFDDIPTQVDENLENGELFIDADAFEFLLNQNKSTTVLDSGKESLFLKFDPLFAKRVSSDGVLAALSRVQKRQSTPKKPSTIIQQMPKENTNANVPVAGPSNDRENYVPFEELSEDLSTSPMSKPMMVVNPAVSSITAQRRAAATPKLNRRSLTFTSPAMAVIDRLLSLSGNASHLNDDTSGFNLSREHNETDFAITQLRELLAEKEIHVHNLRCESKELKERLSTLELQVKNLETESTERLKKINDLNERLSEKTKINKSMATVVEEYERTIASLIAESEQDKKHHAEERLRLINERDEQTAHLTSMELSFSDLHSKYEKSKQVILTCKANEDTYLKTIKEFEESCSKMQTNYELLKQHATSKLNHANQELEKMNRAHEAEVLKLSALIKRKELDITSLEESLAQKNKANEELTAICDELINKVGK